MKYYIIAGEASGDLHGSHLIKELQKLDANAVVRCWGGDKMQAAGATVVKHYKDLAFMGFIEVIKNLRTIFRNIAFCKKDIFNTPPDVLILIDYPGFNLRIAKWAKDQGIKIIYYISPQVWAWKEGRVNLIKKCVDKMLVILPFEKEFYKKWNYEVDYVGHPLVEVITNEKLRIKNEELENDHRQLTTDDRNTITVDQRIPNLKPQTSNPKPETSNLIALLPGSRKQEILKKLPIMLQVAKYFPEYEFVVAKAPGLDKNFYDTLLAPYNNVTSVENKTYHLLANAKAALVTSGTATLETALFGVPQVVCYKGNAISYQIAKRLIKIKFISLVNLIMDKEVVKELIQENLTVENLKKELDNLLNNEPRKEQIKEDYSKLKNLLQQGGNASANAAKIIISAIT
jgi:lipid-A-disaccharide synthase